MLSQVAGPPERARRALRIPRRRGLDRVADAAHDVTCEPSVRSRRAARAGPLRTPDAAARRSRDLRWGARRRLDLAARRLRQGTPAPAVAWRADRRGADNARRRARRPLR